MLKEPSDISCPTKPTPCALGVYAGLFANGDEPYFKKAEEIQKRVAGFVSAPRQER